jgi:hypothetical protein
MRKSKGAQGCHGDDESVTSEENTLTIKSLRETFSKIKEIMDYSGTMLSSMFILPMLKLNWKICCHAIKN